MGEQRAKAERVAPRRRKARRPGRRSQAALIAATLALVSMGFENKANELGERLIWLDRAVVERAAPCVAPARATATSSGGWRWKAAKGAMSVA